MKLILYIDGGSRGNPGRAGAGVSIRTDRGRTVFEAGFFLDRMTNNMAEYNALLKGLDAADRAGATELEIISDSELLVRQINGDYRVKSPTLLPLFEQALVRLHKLSRWRLRHVRREENRRADALANRAMDSGEDVVEVEFAGPTGKPVADDRTNAQVDESKSRVVVRCVDAPNPRVCPAPCPRRTKYNFGKTVPAGICLSVAADIIRAVQKTNSSGEAPTEVRCRRAGCGARFEIARE